jgi:hypothetical protein
MMNRKGKNTSAVPRMAELVAVGFTMTGPVAPVAPENPDCDWGLLTAPEVEDPVFPLLVALDWAETAPELPVRESGLTVTVVVPPAPPLEELVATLEPPTALDAPIVNTEMLTAGAPGPARTRVMPASPPSPPRAKTPVPLTALPDVPDAAFAAAPAPELALLTASPKAAAPPVFPELPDAPEVAVPPKVMAEPRMAVLTAIGLDVAGPVDPVAPEVPETAIGLLTAPEEALPVLPELVALDCAAALPVLPDVAMGVAVTFTPPPAPPLAEPTATLEPPMAEDEPITPNERLSAGPPASETATESPPAPPVPPRATTLVPLTAAPVLPDAALLVALAPELAVLLALPAASAGPVLPEAPELPEVALPPVATAVPRMAVLVAVGLDVAAPVDPVGPELPETATGLLTADDEAGPVLPVLVALDCEDADPEFPDVATGLTLTVEPPPAPPLAELVDTLEPPVADELPRVAADTLVAEPPAPDAAADRPPAPPLPPPATTVVWFTAAPVAPEPAVEPEPAPDEAELLAAPVATAAPVEPEFPEFPVVAWAHEGVDCRSRMARTAAAKARMAQPSRLKDRMVAVFMRYHLPPDLAPPSGSQLTPGFGTSRPRGDPQSPRAMSQGEEEDASGSLPVFPV